MGPRPACAGAGGNKVPVSSLSLETDNRNMSNGLRARGQLPRVQAQRASHQTCRARRKGAIANNCSQLQTFVPTAGRSCAQLRTFARIARDALQPRAHLRLPVARHDTAFTWTWMAVGQANLQALKDIMSRKLGCRPWASPVSNKRIRSRVVVGKRAQLGTIALICARLLALVLKGPLNRPRYQGSDL